MHQSKFVFIMAVGLTLVGCGAGVSQQTTVERPIDLDALGYAAALDSVLDEYEAEVSSALADSYGSHAEAWATTQSLLATDLAARLDRHLVLQGLDQVGLTAYAAAHPEFVREHNARQRASVARARPQIYAVLGRVDGTAAAPLEVPLDVSPTGFDGLVAALGAPTPGR